MEEAARSGWSRREAKHECSSKMLKSREREGGRDKERQRRQVEGECVISEGEKE